MAEKKIKTFHAKSFTSFVVTFSFIIMSLTGIVLYFAPPGRVALWSIWTFWALTKEEWQALHTIFSLVFMIGAVFHIYFNWSVLMSYLKRKLQKGIHRKNELAFSTVLTLLIFVFTLLKVPPFSSIMIWGDALKNSWSSEATEPPIPHAESMRLDELATMMKLELAEVIQRLNQKGIVPDSNSVLMKDLAEKYHLSPNSLYATMTGPAKSNQPLATGRDKFGYGRMTVEQVCQQLNLSVEVGLERLKQENISARADDNLKSLAIELKKTPTEIVDIIKGETESSGLQ